MRSVCAAHWRFASMVATVTLATFPIGTIPTYADDLIGAGKILERIGKATGSEEKKTDPAKGEAEAFMRDLESFRAERASLPVEVAVDRWLKLYARFGQLPPESLKSRNPYAQRDAKTPSLESLVASMPPPAAWDTLKTRLASLPATGNANRDTVLRVLLAYLTRDDAALDKGIADLKASMALSGRQRFDVTLIELQRPGIGKGGVPTAESFAAYLQSLRGARKKGRITVMVPDLVQMAREKQAEELVLKALAVPGVSLRVPSGGKTLDLAKRLTIKRADLLTEPQWELVTGLDDIELYEAINRRFPEKSAGDKAKPDIFQPAENPYARMYADTDNARNPAKVLYLLGLIGKSRVKEAVELSKRMEADEFKSSEFERRWHSFNKNRYAQELSQWCRAVLTDRAELPLWKQCGLVASESGETGELVGILDAAIQKPNLTLEARLNVQSRKVELLLAMDRADEALELLRTIVKSDDSKETPQSRLAVSRIKFRMALKIVTLGRLLSRKALTDEGEALLLGQLGSSANLADMAGGELGNLIDRYIKDGQFTKAEHLAIEVMLAMLQAPELSANSMTRDWAVAGGALSSQLIRLAQLYNKAGRFGDTLTLLEKSPGWGAFDLIDVDDNQPSLAPIAADALHNSGRDAESAEILKWYLHAKPNDDAAYQTLTDIRGASLIPWLDQLQRRDRFEERPLIWKAVLLKKEGKLDEAEAVVRQALKIDPTDGEQPPGDRVRAYAVLGDILKAKGKLDDAGFFERVVESVRLAEQGDQLTEAGLLKRSLGVYEQASALFADAYCVQWRLAERLASIGDLAGAKKHYEIAFERMPEQFGQVAHFCFGCQGVFTHQQSVSVAEEVLMRAAKTSPNKPQVHYLLGQLREAQGRKADAFAHFRRAAEIDPEYLDAWKAAYALRNDVFLSQAEMDEIALRMVRLDPLNRHSGLDHGEITDVRALWTIYQDMDAERQVRPKRLFPLTASKQRLEELAKQFGAEVDLMEMKRHAAGKVTDLPEPGDAVIRNAFARTLLGAAGQHGLEIE